MLQDLERRFHTFLATRKTPAYDKGNESIRLHSTLRYNPDSGITAGNPARILLQTGRESQNNDSLPAPAQYGGYCDPVVCTNSMNSGCARPAIAAGSAT